MHCYWCKLLCFPATKQWMSNRIQNVDEAGSDGTCLRLQSQHWDWWGRAGGLGDAGCKTVNCWLCTCLQQPQSLSDTLYWHGRHSAHRHRLEFPVRAWVLVRVLRTDGIKRRNTVSEHKWTWEGWSEQEPGFLALGAWAVCLDGLATESRKFFSFSMNFIVTVHCSCKYWSSEIQFVFTNFSFFPFSGSLCREFYPVWPQNL